MRISDCSSDVCSSDLHLCPEKENDVFTVLDLFAVSFEKTRRLRSEFGYLGFYGMRCAGALATRVPDTLFDGPDGKRSEEGRVGKEWVSPCRSRGVAIY